MPKIVCNVRYKNTLIIDNLSTHLLCWIRPTLRNHVCSIFQDDLCIGLTGALFFMKHTLKVLHMMRAKKLKTISWNWCVVRIRWDKKKYTKQGDFSQHIQSDSDFNLDLSSDFPLQSLFIPGRYRTHRQDIVW